MLSNLLDQAVMFDEILVLLMRKRDPKTFTAILMLDGYSRFQLHLQGGLAVNMVSEEIRPLPIVGQLDAVKSVIGKCGRNFLKVE